tara:strand:+ start:592 stop:846 length:255 start_codon:yes stop_codon:yes gene_type:complete
MSTGWIVRHVAYALVVVATSSLVGCVTTPGVVRGGDDHENNVESQNPMTTEPAEKLPIKKKRRKITPDERRALVEYYKELNRPS